MNVNSNINYTIMFHTHTITHKFEVNIRYSDEKLLGGNFNTQI